MDQHNISQRYNIKRSSIKSPSIKGSVFKQYFARWLHRRVPPSRQQTLHRKNIFIFPSSTGFGFLLTVVLLWLLGTNYQNNLILVLAFLLLSLMNTCILYTYANLSGISLEVKAPVPCFAGDHLVVTCTIKNSHRKKGYNNIVVGWPSAPQVYIDVPAQQSRQVSLLLPTSLRGLYQAERLTIATVYPLGLIRAWSRLDVDVEYVVYPKPINIDLPKPRLTAVDGVIDDADSANTTLMDDTEYVDESESDVMGSVDLADDLSHLREYQEGDSPAHIAWKIYAKGQGLATKVYESDADDIESEPQYWLCWDDFPGVAVEQRLSYLCDGVLQMSEAGLHYGLILPSQRIDLGTGAKHQQKALLALAVFDSASDKVMKS